MRRPSHLPDALSSSAATPPRPLRASAKTPRTAHGEQAASQVKLRARSHETKRKSARKVEEEETAALRAEVVQLRQELAEQAAAHDALLSLAAHELRGPLTALKGYAQLLARQGRITPLPQTLSHSIEVIEQQSSRLADMVGELHDAARIRRGDFELIRTQIDLAPLVEAEMARRRALAPDHTLLLLAETTPLVGRWDAMRLGQVMHDLLDNATRYSPEGSVVVVRLGQADGMALVSVRDQGIGVARDEWEHIFDYIYRAPNAEQRNLSGVGLGLFISRAIVTKLGGRLWVATSDTHAGGGTEMRFTLPLHA